MTTRQPPPDRIQWHEGQLLCPQHFQQESGRVDALVAWHALAANPFGWGLQELVVDEGLLVTGRLRILRLEGLLQDGTAVHHDAAHEAEPLELDLSPWAELMDGAEVDVYLCLGRASSMRHPGQPSRFRAVQAEPVEDEVSEALAVDIPRMRHHLSLLAGDPPPSAYLSLKLLTVQKVNEVVRRGALEPAWLALPPLHPLLQRALALSAQMRSKAAFMARQTANPSSRLEDRLAGIELRERLSVLTEGLPLLEGVVRSPVVQPYALYLTLCALLGPFARLRPGAVPLQPPVWSQADPSGGLEPLFVALEDLLGEVSQDWRVQVFRFEAGVFELPMQPEWIGRRLVLGMRGSPGPEQSAWLQGAIVGSRTIWTSLRDRRMLGAPRQAITEAPELSLRSNTGYTLFAVEPLPEFIVGDQDLLVSNANEAAGVQRPQQLVLFIKG